MYNNANAEQLMEKWSPVLEHGEGIQDAHKRAVTAQLLENQAVALQEERAFLSENPITTQSNQAGLNGFTGSPDGAGFSGYSGADGAVADAKGGQPCKLLLFLL